MASPEDNCVYVCNGGGWQSVSSGWHKCWYVKARACVCLFVSVLMHGLTVSVNV